MKSQRNEMKDQLKQFKRQKSQKHRKDSFAVQSDNEDLDAEKKSANLLKMKKIKTSTDLDKKKECYI